MKSKNGFAWLKAFLAVGGTGTLIAMVSLTYQSHVAHIQLAESVAMIEAEKDKVISNFVKRSKCSLDGNTYSVLGEYGALEVGGEVDQNALMFPKAQLKTGCALTYTFAKNGVLKSLQGQKVVADVLNNGLLSKNSITTVEAESIPKLITLPEDTSRKQAESSAYNFNEVNTVKTPLLNAVGQYDYMQDTKYGNLYCHSAKDRPYNYYTSCYLFSKDRKKVLGTINATQYDGPFLPTYYKVSASLLYVITTGQCPSNAPSFVKTINTECEKAGYKECGFHSFGKCSMQLQDPPKFNLVETGYRAVNSSVIGNNLYNFRNFWFNAHHGSH